MILMVGLLGIDEKRLKDITDYDKEHGISGSMEQTAERLLSIALLEETKRLQTDNG